MEKHIYIIRHGQTDYNRLGIVQGQGVDTSLNDTGRMQALAFYEHYRQTPFEAVLTSALKRTHETVSPFLEQGLPWEQFPDLNEISWGRHEGQESTSKTHAQYKAVTNAWKAGDLEARLEDAESAAEMALRLSRFVEHLRQRPEQTLLVCSHGRAMRALMCLLQDEHLQYMDRYSHDNTGLYKAAYQNTRFHFLLQNDTAHLSQLDFKIA